MPPRFGNVGYRSSSSSSRRSPGTARQQQQRSQRTSSRGAQRGVSKKTTYVTPKKEQIDRNIKTQQQKNKIRDVKAEQEKNEGAYLDNRGADSGNPFVTYRQQQESRQKTAYDASKDRQAEMQKAISLAYNVNKDDGSGRSIIDQSTSNFQNLDDEQKQFLIDSGFAAAESSGVLGGVSGAEKVVNELKNKLQNAKTEGEYNDALAALDKLNANIGGWKATDMQQAMGLLQHDPSAVYSWSDDIDRYEGGTYLKDAFYDMQSKNLTPKNYTNYMNKITAFGHAPDKGIGSLDGGGGGWGGGYGGGGGGSGGSGGSGGFQYNKHAQQGIAQGPPVGPGTLQEQVNQGFLGGMGTRFSRGGIVSLLRLRR